MQTCRTVRRRALPLALAACCASVALATPAEVPSDIVHFEINFVTSPGDSIFVSGNIPELGNADVRRSVKMLPGTFSPGSLPWTLDVSIPHGTAFTYQYFAANDDVANYDMIANFESFAGSGPFNFSTTPATPTLRDRIIYAPITESANFAIFQTPAGTRSRRFLPLTGRSDLKAAVLWDQPFGPGIDAQIIAGTIDSPLHTLFFRNANAFNYEATTVPNTAGTKVTFALPTTLIPATRTVNNITGRGIQVWLPRSYAVNTAKRYPVLYMHDGQNVFVPGGPFGTWQAEVTTSQGNQRAKVRELIIVAIDNSSQRSAEYVPEFGNATVNNTRYNQFIVNELKPHIDANYRTLTDRDNTGVAGSSFGGLATCSLGLDHSGVFGRLGIFSPSFWAGQTDNRVSAGQIPMTTRIYMDAGDTSDDGDLAQSVRDALLVGGRVLSRDLFFQIGLFQQHNEAAWSQRFPQMLEALYPLVEEPAALSHLPQPRKGDFNGDGCVELSDLARMLAAFGTCVGATAYDYAADLDASNCVDLTDLAELLGTFGACG
ncbi:MAG: alpha/beta hydrolase-fold protein [Phycisphaerae bacterium]